MTRAAIAIVACLTVAPMLVGCSGTQAPSFSVLGGSVKERGPEATVVEFIIDADNANPDALPLQEVEYTVSRNGVVVFSGKRSAEAIIRRYGKQQFLLPAAFASAESPEGEYRISGTVTYIAPGALAETLFDQDIVRPSAEFSGTATVR